MQLRMTQSIQRLLSLPSINQGLFPELLVIAIAYSPKNSSQLYQKFDLVVLLSHGRALYSGPGGFAPTEYFSNAAPGIVAPYEKGYNVAEYLLEVANDPPVSLFQLQQARSPTEQGNDVDSTSEKVFVRSGDEKDLSSASHTKGDTSRHSNRTAYATTFLTQLQHLCGREWKTLKRDKTLFVTHVAVASILGLFCGPYILDPLLLILKSLFFDRWPLFPHGRQYRWISITNWLPVFPREHLGVCKMLHL
jgi:hypothetical protein